MSHTHTLSLSLTSPRTPLTFPVRSVGAPMAALCSMDSFLKQCEQSGDAAYGAFRSLLERLEDPNSRAQARVFLSDLQNQFGDEEASQQCLRKFHFRIDDIVLDQCEGTLTADVLSLLIAGTMLSDHCLLDTSFFFWSYLATSSLRLHISMQSPVRNDWCENISESELKIFHLSSHFSRVRTDTINRLTVGDSLVPGVILLMKCLTICRNYLLKQFMD